MGRVKDVEIEALKKMKEYVIVRRNDPKRPLPLNKTIAECHITNNTSVKRM